MSTTPRAIKSTAIQSPTKDNHEVVLRQLKEVAEIGQRQRGDPQDSFVRVSELVRLGIVRMVNNTLQAPSTLGTSGSTVVPIGRQILTVHSIQGGGDLSADRTLSLVGDTALPGNNKFYGTDGSGTRGWFTSTVPTAANPSAQVGLTAINGAASTYMRSDGAPALNQGIAPTWTGMHSYSSGLVLNYSASQPMFFGPGTSGAAGAVAMFLYNATPSYLNFGITDPAFAGSMATGGPSGAHMFMGSGQGIPLMLYAFGSALWTGTNTLIKYGNPTDNQDHTFFGNLLAREYLYAGADGTNGYQVLVQGSPTVSGYHGFYTPDNTRQGYIGDASGAVGNDTGTLNYVAGAHAFFGSFTVNGVSFQPISAKLTAYAGGDTPSAFTLGIVDSVDAAAWRAAIGAGTSSVSVTPAALTKTDDTNITLTLGGTPASALLQAASLTLGWTGTLAKDRGGWGLDASSLTGYVKAAGAGAMTASATIPYSDLTGTPTIPTLADGTYTPTLTNVANAGSLTNVAAQYMRVGDTVTASVAFTFNPSASISTRIGVSLPVASALANAGQLAGGVGFVYPSGYNGGVAYGDAANDRAEIGIGNIGNGFTVEVYAQFTYRVV